MRLAEYIEAMSGVKVGLQILRIFIWFFRLSSMAGLIESSL